MVNPQLPKLSPSVGGGLPGLPRRKGPRGEVTFPIPGTFSWIVPKDVFSISGVTVAGGGGSVFNGAANDDVSSGAGCGLSWVNDVKLTPGSTVTIIVGAGGGGKDIAGSTTAFAGGTSSISVNGIVVCEATGGAAGLIGTAVAGGTNTVGDGGGTGGAGAFLNAAAKSFATGGGAAGYSGVGGAGISGTTNIAGNAGAGGGGGSGGISGISVLEANGSGGVGLNGEGDSGAGGTAGVGGGGGSDGQDGENAVDKAVGFSGIFGAGASAANSGNTTNSANATSGGGGAVRIIFGAGRAFPSTNTGQ